MSGFSEQIPCDSNKGAAFTLILKTGTGLMLTFVDVNLANFKSTTLVLKTLLKTLLLSKPEKHNHSLKSASSLLYNLRFVLLKF
jgi:hypothetical protein